jgi:hypothetical protein
MASTTAASLVGVAAVVVVLGFATDRIDFRCGISMYFHAKNLTNAPFRVYEGSPNRPIQREYYGETYEAGVQRKYF